MFIKVVQIVGTEKFVNLVAVDSIKRIVFIAGEPICEIYFKTPVNITKKDEELEDVLIIEVNDKKEFGDLFIKHKLVLG